MCGVCVAPDGGGIGGSKDETAPGKRLVRLGNMRVGVERAADFVLLAAFGVPRSEGSTAARNPHDSPSSHFPFINRSVVNIASGAVLGLFSGFVLARTSFLPSPPFLLPPSFLFLFPPPPPPFPPTPPLSFLLIPVFIPSSYQTQGQGTVEAWWRRWGWDVGWAPPGSGVRKTLRRRRRSNERGKEGGREGGLYIERSE